MVNSKSIYHGVDDNALFPWSDGKLITGGSSIKKVTVTALLKYFNYEG